MPEQGTSPSLPVASQPFESPWETEIIRFGSGGLNLKKAVDVLSPTECSRLDNALHTVDGELTGRPGQTALTNQIGTRHHSVERLENPATGLVTRLWGIDGTLQIGLSGGLTEIDTGYSGDPLSMVPYRVASSGESWMFVADRSRFRKVRHDGLVLPVGIPAPASEPTCALQPALVRPLCAFDAGDGSNAATWTGHAGYGAVTNEETGVVTHLPTGHPTAADCTAPSGTGVVFTTLSAFTTLDWFLSFWTHEFSPALDLSMFPAGEPAEDEDLIHLNLWVNHPGGIDEIRIYLVASPDFDADDDLPPGVNAKDWPDDGGPIHVPDPSSGEGATNFFVKTFRQSDFASFIRLDETAVEAGDRYRTRRQIEEYAEGRKATDPTRTGNAAVRRSLRDPGRGTAPTFSGGQGQWDEFGVIALPLKRGDFQRFGTDTDLGWQAIYGIVVYVKTTGPNNVRIALDDMFLTGGSGPNTSATDAQAYDYRYTHYDPRTGAESNPSPEMAEEDWQEAARQAVEITPAASLDAAHVQRFYRRGGSVTDDWYYIGENAANGAAFLDIYTDEEAVGTGVTAPLDHYPPITTVDAAGETVEGQPPVSIWGPVQDLIFATGDPYRPGHVYYCRPGEPDHWPLGNRTEVTSPTERLLGGGAWGGQAYCFSSKRVYVLYPSLTSGSTNVTATPTTCARGPLSAWAWAIGPGGMYFVDRDGIWVTSGGDPQILSDDIEPLFKGEARNGYQPIDFDAMAKLRCLAIYRNELWFLYQDNLGIRYVLIFSLLWKFWRRYSFKRELEAVTVEQGSQTMLLGGRLTGRTYLHEGTSDDGDSITALARTGCHDQGRPREDKLYGDLVVDADRNDNGVIVRTRLNNDLFENASQTLAGAGSEITRYILDPFGARPQKARNISVELSWIVTTAPPVVNFAGISYSPQPEQVVMRATQWDSLGAGEENYLTGVILDCDTFNGAKEIYVEYDPADGSAWQTLGPYTVTCDGRHKRSLSWAAVKANLVRIRAEQECHPWILYKAEWISQDEPPRISKWDINYENVWDSYYTGLDLECNTFGASKSVRVWVDGVEVAGSPFTVTANGRLARHLTFGPGRGHIFRFAADDDNPGLLYAHRWHLEAEPSEQTNWNQNYTVAGTEAPKYFKGMVFECDTYGVDKSVEVQIDHTTVTTLTVNTNDRNVIYKAFPRSLGRILRILPVDAHPGRLYTWYPIFDEEPLELDRWEIQETDHGQHGWQVPLWAQITYKSPTDVSLVVEIYGQAGQVVASDAYTLPLSGTLKVKQFVPFVARRGVLFRYILTSASPFTLYREESHVVVRPWNGDGQIEHPFGNDDISVPTRSMINAQVAASRGGGGTS